MVYRHCNVISWYTTTAMLYHGIPPLQCYIIVYQHGVGDKYTTPWIYLPNVGHWEQHRWPGLEFKQSADCVELVVLNWNLCRFFVERSRKKSRNNVQRVNTERFYGISTDIKQNCMWRYLYICKIVSHVVFINQCLSVLLVKLTTLTCNENCYHYYYFRTNSSGSDLTMIDFF